MTPAKKNSTPRRVTEPAVDPAAAPEPAAAESGLTPVQEAIHVFLRVLDQDPERVASVEVTQRSIRVIGKDRSFRGYRIDGIA